MLKQNIEIEINHFKEKYNEFHLEESVARATISNMFDVLNHHVMDNIIGKYDYSERKIELPYPIIRIMDRGYFSIVDMYYLNKSNDKYVVSLKKNAFKRINLEHEK